jgi:hypothetical protein
MDAGLSRERAQGIARWLLAGGAMIPFALSLVFHAVDSPASQPAPGPPRPALAFQQYLVDRGQVEPSAVVTARFAFTNRGRETVTVKDLLPSCGCLNPKLEKRVYAPGESGEFFLHVQTANEQPGQKEYFCKVVYDDPQTREVDLAFRVQLPERQVTVRPKSLIVYQFSAQPQTETIVVSDYRARPLRLIEARCTSDLVTVAIGDPGTDEEGATTIPVSVSIAADIPPGRYPAWILLTTDDSVFPELRVPLLIERHEEMTPSRAGR